MPREGAKCVEKVEKHLEEIQQNPSALRSNDLQECCVDFKKTFDREDWVYRRRRETLDQLQKLKKDLAKISFIAVKENANVAKTCRKMTEKILDPEIECRVYELQVLREAAKASIELLSSGHIQTFREDILNAGLLAPSWPYTVQDIDATGANALRLKLKDSDNKSLKRIAKNLKGTWRAVVG